EAALVLAALGQQLGVHLGGDLVAGAARGGARRLAGQATEINGPRRAGHRRAGEEDQSEHNESHRSHGCHPLTIRGEAAGAEAWSGGVVGVAVWGQAPVSVVRSEG